MKKKNPLVSIIVPAFRAEYFTADLIKNLSSIKYPNFEVIMVFDPSEDDGVLIAKRETLKKKNFKIITNKRRLGISRSLNLGIKKSQGEYIAFFMTDMYVDAYCLSELVKFIDQADKSVGAVAAKIYDYHKRQRIQTYRMFLLPQTGFVYIPEYGLRDSKIYNRPFEGYSGIDGTLFKREVFQKAGMFDLDIDTLINDLDMVWRIWLAGYKVIRIPRAKIYHWSLKEGRGGVNWEFSYARMMDLFIQNYSLKYLLIYLPQLVAVYALRSVVTLAMGNPDPLKGFIKAIIWSFFYLPRALKKRKIIQSQVRKVSDEYLHQTIFANLSLWDFYNHIKRVQKNITPIMLTKEASNEKILTYSR